MESNNSLNQQKNKCIDMLRHYMRTDLYFIVNPIQLALTVLYKIIVLQEKVFTENEFGTFVEEMKVDFSLFGKEVMGLMEQFPVSFFSNKKVEAANKKFKIIQSKIKYYFKLLLLIFQDKANRITSMKRKNNFSNSEKNLLNKRTK